MGPKCYSRAFQINCEDSNQGDSTWRLVASKYKWYEISKAVKVRTVYLWRLGDLSLETSLLWFCLGLCYWLLLTEFCFMRQGTTVLLRLFSSDPPSSVTQVAGLQHAVPHPPSLTPQAGFFFSVLCACVSLCVPCVDAWRHHILGPRLPWNWNCRQL